MNQAGQPLRVWAPDKVHVEVTVAGRRSELVAGPGGWWELPGLLAAGARYGFFLDGRGPYPDPRSGSQPDGVHGASALVDHRSFAWTDDGYEPPPWEHAVVYEVHVGTFSPSGTFAGALGHLDALVELGVTHVELMPVAEFPGVRGWGYDGVDLFAVHHAYGGPDGLKAFVDGCHQRGLAVILDVVYNHLGPDGNYLNAYGPYFSNEFTTPWGDAPNLSGPGSAEVRRFFIDNALMWLGEFRLDGLRLDAADRIIDPSPRHLLAELAAEVRVLEARCQRRKVLIAEVEANDPAYALPPAMGGFGFDAQWSDDLHHAIHSALCGERDGYYADFGPLSEVAAALRHGFVYAGRFSKFRGRPHGKPATGLPGHALLGYLQNHDQVGNRALGERIGQLPGVSALHQQLGAALVLLGPFIPLIFMGEEWAASTPFQYFTDHSDPVLARAVSAGRKREFGAAGWQPHQVPDPQAPDAFSASKLRWHERHRAGHASMLEWYHNLLALRRAHPQLDATSWENLHCAADPHGQWIWLRRGRWWLVAAPAGPASVPAAPSPASVQVLAAGAAASIGAHAIHFPGPGIVILREP